MPPHWISDILTKVGFVNETYYIKKYPDVAKAGMKAGAHYFEYGRREGRYPNRFLELGPRSFHTAKAAIVSRLFLDKAFYTSYYPDVLSSGLSPSAHYRLLGSCEGRHFNRSSYKFLVTLRFLRHALHESESNIAAEGLISEFRAIVFDCARRGRLPTVRLWIARKKFKSEESHEKLFAGKFPIFDIAKKIENEQWTPLIESREIMEFLEPEVIGATRDRPLRRVAVPCKWLATVHDAQVIGGFQVLASGKFVIYEPAADPTEGFVAGIWPYVSSIGQEANVLTWFRYSKEAFLPEAILLSGRCSPNYYHWLIEYLGKSYLLEQRDDLRKVPLIVDDGMFPQEFESLQAVLPDWPIHRLQKDTLLMVGRLHIPSTHTNLADNLREPMWKSSALCFKTLAYLRSNILERLHVRTCEIPSARKVFLTRKNGRNITNNIEVEAVVASHGYEIVDTGSMSFEQQVQMFFQASFIVGAMGAAFSNLIFCRPGTQVLALSSPYTQLFCSQSNMAQFAGSYYRILVGQHPAFQPGDEHTVSDPNLFLDSFSIDVATLGEALSAMEPQQSRVTFA